MRKIISWLLISVSMVTFLTGCGGSKEQTTAPQAEPVNLTISAAASLKDAAEELKSLYAIEHQDVNITYNFGSSGTLQKQIEEGAPADLFISAGQRQMNALEEKGLIIKESRQDLLGNDLVLVVQKDSQITGFEDLTKPEVERISIGTPESVPAGQYAKDALIFMQLWDKLQPKLVLAKDVRQVLTYVETGNVAAGMVYSSDAVMGKDIKAVTTAPTDSHQPIVYPMAILKNTKNQKAVEEFTAFLSGEEAAKVFEKYGFKAIKK